MTATPDPFRAPAGLFTGLPVEDLDRLREGFESIQAKKGDVIVRQGDMDRSLFVVVSGSLRVSVVSPEGKEISLGILEENESFGELALLDGQARSATVTATRVCDLLMLRREPFIRMLHAHPDMAIRMLESMAGRLRSADELYEDSVFLEVPERLAKWILRLARRHGREQQEGVLLDMRLSQYELGTLANASRESVNKQLKAWEAEGIIETGRGWVLVRDWAELERRTEPTG